jgi:hypothetical protein
MSDILKAPLLPPEYLYRCVIRGIKSRMMSMRTRNVTRWDGRDAYKSLVGKPEGKRPLGVPRHRWKYRIRMDLREIGREDVD